MSCTFSLRWLHSILSCNTTIVSIFQPFCTSSQLSINCGCVAINSSRFVSQGSTFNSFCKSHRCLFSIFSHVLCIITTSLQWTVFFPIVLITKFAICQNNRFKIFNQNNLVFPVNPWNQAFHTYGM